MQPEPVAHLAIAAPTSNTLAVVGMIGAVLLLALVLTGVFLLAWHKSITGTDALGVVTVIVGIAGGAFGVHLGVKTAQNDPAR